MSCTKVMIVKILFSISETKCSRLFIDLSSIRGRED